MLKKREKEKKHNPFSVKYKPNFEFIVKFLLIVLVLSGIVIFLYLLLNREISF